MIRTGRVTLFTLFLIYLTVALIFYWLGRRGKRFVLRRIPALDAIEEGVGRAVEMQRPVHWTAGHPRASKLYDATGAYLAAGFTILIRVAQVCMEKGARLLVSVGHPELYPIARDIVDTVYTLGGKPEEFRGENIVLVPEYSYLAAVIGRIIRERPATHIQTGYFWYQDALVLPEVARGEGCFNITGGQVTALPFLIVQSDYTLIADELFAASAQITEDPVLIGYIAGLDVIKGIMIALVVAGVTLASLGIQALSTLIKF
jgi:hypothetical protein